jgi:hypothetical protein
MKAVRLAAVVLVLFLSACHHQYRLLDENLKPMQPMPARSAVPFPLPMIEQTTTSIPEPNGGDKKVTLETAYIEFKDSGCMFDPAGEPTDGLKYQLDQTRKLIKARKPSQVVLYVHGWNNNASEQSSDVTRFRYALAYLGARLDLSKGPLLGIFIGWRGGTFKGGVLGPLTFVTYWSRKQGARRVAEGHCTGAAASAAQGLPSVIDELLDATEQANPDRHFYSIGHSFGARVLEGALDKTKYIKGIYDAINARPPVPYTPKMDLVLLINPATDSWKTTRFLHKMDKLNSELEQQTETTFVVHHPGYDDQLCREAPDDRRCQPYPLVVEVSSVGDFLTGAVMPVANAVNYVPPFLFLAEPSARLLSAPFSPWLRTHTVTSCDGKATAEGPCGTPHPKSAFDFDLPASPPLPSRPAGSPNNLSWERVETMPSAKQDWVWIMTVDTKISLSHGDVWNANIAAMMFALIDPNGPTRSESTSGTQALQKILPGAKAPVPPPPPPPPPAKPTAAAPAPPLPRAVGKRPQMVPVSTKH